MFISLLQFIVVISIYGARLPPSHPSIHFTIKYMTMLALGNINNVSKAPNFQILIEKICIIYTMKCDKI